MVREYIPTYRSGAHALMLTLYRQSQVIANTLYFNKVEMIGVCLTYSQSAFWSLFHNNIHISH